MKERKRITKTYENCITCGLPIITCICDSIKKVSTKAKFIILSSEKELYRKTNTANLLNICNTESTEIIIWERKKTPESIVNYISSDKYKVFLVFPDINEDLRKRTVEYGVMEKIPVFIILDGTWGEAWKMIKKSEYLKELPIISLKTYKVSKFTLRRGQEEGNLCTVETAIELMKINNEPIESEIIEENFMLFLESYKAGASGHKVIKK